MTRFFVRFPVTTWMIFLVFVVLGVYSIPRLKIEAIPDVNLPTLTITSSWNGASPQAVQRSISIPIEDSMQDVHGIEKVESTMRGTPHSLAWAAMASRSATSRAGLETVSVTKARVVSSARIRVACPPSF